MSRYSRSGPAPPTAAQPARPPGSQCWPAGRISIFWQPAQAGTPPGSTAIWPWRIREAPEPAAAAGPVPQDRLAEPTPLG